MPVACAHHARNVSARSCSTPTAPRLVPPFCQRERERMSFHTRFFFFQKRPLMLSTCCLPAFASWVGVARKGQSQGYAVRTSTFEFTMECNIADDFDEDKTPRGAVLVADRSGHSHWGVCAGNGKVIQCPGSSGSVQLRGKCKINQVSTSNFEGDSDIYVCKVKAGECCLWSPSVLCCSPAPARPVDFPCWDSPWTRVITVIIS